VQVIELFEQRLELVKEYPSWMEYLCPLCKSEGLKINKSTGYYKNYKCNCDTKRITAYIYQDSGITYVPKEKVVPKIVEPIPNLLNIKLTRLTNPPLLTDLNDKYRNLDGKVVYYHSTNQRTKRINRIITTDKHGNKKEKKIVIPQILVNGSWVNGIGEGTFPLFTNERTLVSELIIAVEGQKCVEYLNYKQIEAISLLGSYTTSITKIQEVIEISRSLIPNIKQILYLPDLDVKGMQKADIFQRAMWEMKMPCKVFDLRGELVKSTNFVQGYDIADYITENKDVDLVEVFENEFRRCI